MKKTTQFLIAFFLIAITTNAQNSFKAIESFVKQTNAIVTVNENSGIAEFIRFEKNDALELQGISLEEKAISFLDIYGGVFNVKNVETSFSFENLKTDTHGFQHLVLNQVHNGVPIYDGKLKFHFNAESRLTSVNGNYLPNVKLEVTPRLNTSQVNEIALQTIVNQNLNVSGEPLKVNSNTLYVFQKGLAQGYYTSRHLAYEVEVRNDNDVREFVFVDANNGDIIEQFTGMAHAIDRIVYEANIATTVWEEGDAFPGALTLWQRNEVETAGHMYYLFNNTFGYESYDGAAAQMRTINNNPSVANASWNGATTNYRDGTAADDVIAHEWGHAYTEYTSGLIYAWQSGAINESYSDIWGETIDILNNYEDGDEDNSLRTGCASSSRWRMGEDATFFSAPIRDLWDPTCNGHPGKVTDGEYWCSEGDSGGVHINSGIPNHAYALLVDGGTYNGQTINGIGFTKAAHIFWRAQSAYLTATSDFSSLADALEASCTDLIGVNLEGLTTTSTSAGLSGEILTNADLQDVINAVLAVELRINPDACGFTAILEPTADLCEAATSNPVFTEDWEAGIDGWAISEVPTNPGTWESRPWNLENSLPDGRIGHGLFASNPVNGDCNTDLQNGIVRLESPLITMPDYTDGVFEMAFSHYVSTEYQWDGGNLKYSTNDTDWNIVPVEAFVSNPYNDALNTGDNPMQNEAAFTGSDQGSVSGSWGKSIIDLSLIGVDANASVRFRWELGSDGCNGRIGWYLDDVVIYNCARPLSVDEFDAIGNSIVVYPNPSNGLFTLKKTQNIDLNAATIYDINGRFIKQIDLTNVSLEKEINISALASGIYFMKVKSLETETVIKLVKE